MTSPTFSSIKKRIDAWLFIRSRAGWLEVLTSPIVFIKVSRRLKRGEVLRFGQKVYKDGIAGDIDQLDMLNELRKRAEACAALYDAEIDSYKADDSLEKFWNWDDVVFKSALYAEWTLKKRTK